MKNIKTNAKAILKYLAEAFYNPTEQCEACGIERYESENGWHYDVEGIPLCDDCWTDEDLWDEDPGSL